MATKVKSNKKNEKVTNGVVKIKANNNNQAIFSVANPTEKINDSKTKAITEKEVIVEMNPLCKSEAVYEGETYELKHMSIRMLNEYKSSVNLLMNEYSNLIEMNRGYDFKLFNTYEDKLKCLRAVNEKIIEAMEEKINKLKF